MIYTELTCKAMKIAYDAHHGQTDKNGIPYIFHPIHLAEAMDDEISCCAALLHDVVEDTAITLEQLKEIFPKEVTDALALLTHGDGVPYSDYVRSIKTNPIAVKVKLADLNHNSDESRLTNSSLPADTLRRLRRKYAEARAILEAE